MCRDMRRPEANLLILRGPKYTQRLESLKEVLTEEREADAQEMHRRHRKTGALQGVRKTRRQKIRKQVRRSKEGARERNRGRSVPKGQRRWRDARILASSSTPASELSKDKSDYHYVTARGEAPRASQSR